VNGSIVPGIAGERDVTRPRWLLVLEDDEERTAAFRQAAARIRPAVEPRFWRSAHRFVAEAGEFLPDSVLISLDHDLNLQPGDAGDPDDGLQVAIWLAGRAPTGPVIVHSSNHLRVESMINELRFAQWTWDRVGPFGNGWIGGVWLSCARKLLSAGTDDPLPFS
jgi:hypothetical protein